MKSPFMKIPPSRARGGFTLVEMLVVITIIAIVAAITIPTIVGIVNQGHNAAMATRIADLDRALQEYKNLRGDYPPDFFFIPLSSDPPADHMRATIVPHLVTAYARNAENVTNPANAATYWYDVPQHPRTPGDPDRLPRNLDPAEALVFWLSETNDDVRQPLSRPAAAPITSERKVYYEFDEDQLVDLDNDGWFEYLPRTASTSPLVYFNFRSYTTSPSPASTPPPGSPNPFYRNGWPHYVHPVAAPGVSNVARPYRSERTSPATPYGGAIYMNEESFQIICAGIDEEYGSDVNPSIPPDDASDPTNTVKVFRSGLGYQEGDQDNLTNFSDSQTLENAQP